MHTDRRNLAGKRLDDRFYPFRASARSSSSDFIRTEPQLGVRQAILPKLILRLDFSKRFYPFRASAWSFPSDFIRSEPQPGLFQSILLFLSLSSVFSDRFYSFRASARYFPTDFIRSEPQLGCFQPTDLFHRALPHAELSCPFRALFTIHF
jgi:hypothetical protein